MKDGDLLVMNHNLLLLERAVEAVNRLHHEAEKARRSAYLRALEKYSRGEMNEYIEHHQD
jgi:hypothetical protein